MGSGCLYIDEEIRRILEGSEDEDFSDGSDDMYEPTREEHDESEDEEENSQIEEQQVCETETNQDPTWVEYILPIGRETFIGSSGLQNTLVIRNQDGSVAIEKIMEYFVSDEIFHCMVEKTNSYAELLKRVRTKQFSRMSRWVDVSIEEMKKFFAVILYMGVDKKPSIEHYWKMDPLYYCDFIHKISMSYNRFTNILRCWHFENVQPDNSDVLYRIQPLVDKIIAKFRELYTPSDTIVVDESQIKHQGRLKIKTYNPSKAHKYSIKVYKMCSTNSYTWSYSIHAGSGSAIEGLDKPGSVVVRLCHPLLNEGRLIVADNYYTGIALARYLKDRHTDLCGTLRKNKVNLPKDIIYI
ncbi:piggyBac transposable element-derived protein 4-like [Melitaea cinxia]|uniref:piggyBac transposable element-derived protein 4-like n=1 Tax=Melitaea cinxia TaxID=113334 RepID=UPI001E273326|nr:piggyBac transposable element-derived protein 4-like [Melitaea cinxia]